MVTYSPGLTLGLDEPYFDPVTPPLAPPPSPWPCSLAGQQLLMLDTSFEPYRRDAFRHRSIPSQRDSINLNNEPGEGTINTEGLWRRGQDDWSLGAGQMFLDRKGSAANRFYRSKGVNPWNQWQLSLLNDTQQVWALPNGKTLKKAIQVGSIVIILTEDTIYYTNGGWNNVQVFPITWSLPGAIPNAIPSAYPGLPFGPMNDICTDGNEVWVACAGGIIQISSGSSIPYINDGTPFNSIGFVNDRLMAGSGPRLYNITHGYTFGFLTASGLTNGTTYTTIDVSALPQPVQNGDILYIGDQTWTVTSSAAVGDTALSVSSMAADANYPAGTQYSVQSWASVNWTAATGSPPATTSQLLYRNPNNGWVWSCYAGGSSQIYIGGATVPIGPGAVYRTTLNSDQITLAVPVVALPMEGGEVPWSLRGYLNFVFVGTNYGIRMCQTLAAYDPSGNEGDLRAGSLIPNVTQPVTLPVTGIVGSGRYVYFTWNGYDSQSSGLGRLDLSNFIDALSPAYASDLMLHNPTLLGFLDWDPYTNSPLMTHSTGVYTMSPNPVSSGTLDSGRVTFGIPDDKIAMFLDTRQDVTSKGSMTFSLELDGSNAYQVGSVTSDVSRGVVSLNQLRAEQFNVLTTLTESGNASPYLLRWTLKALPAVASGAQISIVIDNHSKVNVDGTEYDQDPYQIYKFIRSLYASQSVVPYIEGPEFQVDVTVDSYDFLPNKRMPNLGYEGYLVVYLKTLSG